MEDYTIPEQIQQLIDQGALFISNHSGGKDSQAMYNLLSGLIPREQLVVIHAHLPGVEWEGVIEHIQKTVDHEFHVVQAKKTFLEMVEKRGMWPSPSNRQCTSDLKRDPIATLMRKLSREKGFTQVVNCLGLRAEESPGRAKKSVFRVNKKETNSKRGVFEWLPIHTWTIDEVFHAGGHSFLDWRCRVDLYREGNPEAAFEGWNFHPIYVKGMTRLSCKFCIMASEADLCTASTLDPELFQAYNRLEREIDHTFTMPAKKYGTRFLDEVVAGAKAKQKQLDLF
jgi:hypothetical protein